MSEREDTEGERGGDTGTAKRQGKGRGLRKATNAVSVVRCQLSVATGHGQLTTDNYGRIRCRSPNSCQR
jgi:hypothetical protein